jgi:hypothetical protein
LNAGQLRSNVAFLCVKERCTPNDSVPPDVLQTHCKRRTGIELIECNTQSGNNFVTNRRTGITGEGVGVYTGRSVSCAP